MATGDLGLFSYGVGHGLLDLASVVVGVLSTQIYLQAIFSARDVRAARQGAFLCAALIPPVGLLGVVVGLYLRVHVPLAASAQALPRFLETAFPPVVGALFTGGLFVIVLGTAAGLALGVTTNLHVDVVRRLQVWRGGDGSNLTRLRLLAVTILTLALGVVVFGFDTSILSWSYLSMGLRGSAVLAGLCFAVFAPGWSSLKRVTPILYALPVAYLVVRLACELF